MAGLPKERPGQLDSPVVQKLMKLGSRLNTGIYRASGGRIGSTWRVGSAFHKPTPVCLLTTIGRKSGEPRTAPLLYLRRGDDFIVVASQGGLPRNPAWYLNLQATPEVVIEVGRERHELLARTADDAERAELWPKLVEMYADFENYDSWTDRTIPVVICSPR
ncbi:nitroreductase family deazaflavin-dependent oxidoreductase [Gordonia desulfuricans]|uniref:Nitroreductase family deazaflavin-dependent oxidoreductase n=1 Tax=Gordonia desulfuricans TaxID=89051 RepID=A0A7K3LIY3_9ACTN|nr:nitroreductase family deazaflavin-dependent oxidoreductase [Gordonia desulfuricans]NDK88229.1 nitroreductase family deazaflavin-dependent oxidoreductase [Gordonia desulfuricans]